MTSDKIFLVKPLCASEQDHAFISDVELPHYLNTCYIRKDALLEWAKAKKAELLDEELTDVAAGINMGMDMLIYKLEHQ